jgi:hypothetical protein
MDERTFEPLAGFDALRADVTRFVRALVDYPASALAVSPNRFAAE